MTGANNQLISVSPEELKFQCNSLSLSLSLIFCFNWISCDEESCNFDLVNCKQMLLRCRNEENRMACKYEFYLYMKRAICRAEKCCSIKHLQTNVCEFCLKIMSFVVKLF